MARGQEFAHWPTGPLLLAKWLSFCWTTSAGGEVLRGDSAVLGLGQEAQFGGPDRRLGAVGDPQLGGHPLEVPLDCRETYVELLGDLAVSLARHHQAQDLEFPRGERAG